MDVLHEDIKKRASIQIHLDHHLLFKNANEYKFFQLWSNIFTLLIHSSKEKINTQINSIEEKGGLNIIFSLDVQLDSQLFEDSVYDIIMNRQQNSIDLSRAVIKNIVQEYNGTVTINISDEKSDINIHFPIY